MCSHLLRDLYLGLLNSKSGPRRRRTIPWSLANEFEGFKVKQADVLPLICVSRQDSQFTLLPVIYSNFTKHLIFHKTFTLLPYEQLGSSSYMNTSGTSRTLGKNSNYLNPTIESRTRKTLGG